MGTVTNITPASAVLPLGAASGPGAMFRTLGTISAVDQVLPGDYSLLVSNEQGHCQFSLSVLQGQISDRDAAQLRPGVTVSLFDTDGAQPLRSENLGKAIPGLTAAYDTSVPQGRLLLTARPVHVVPL